MRRKTQHNIYAAIIIGMVILIGIKIIQKELSEPVGTSGQTAVTVNYEIRYGSIYTGNQTPIFYKGSEKIPIKNDLGVGQNGLPMSGFFPTHSDLTFGLGGYKTILHIPCIIADTVISHLEVPGIKNVVFMKVVVNKKGSDNIIVIRAIPFLPA